ncbi:fructosamine kinase family protein [Corynebacterium sp. S7]
MESATFTKKGSSPQSAAAEAAGLRWLREASDRVVQVVRLDVEANTLTLRRLDRARPTAEAARWAGAELAKIHAAGAPAFGSPPEGWEGPNFIGRIRQECTPTNRWAPFYTSQRVLPFAEAAAKNGSLSADGLMLVKRACAAIENEDADAVVSRIHGDLWSGNLMFSPDGPHFIDPSAHGGHAHTDLAMLSLFGVSHFEELVEGYETVTPLEPGWRERIPVHQLHPLAVHTLTHGSGYERELEKAARATISLLG